VGATAWTAWETKWANTSFNICQQSIQATDAEIGCPVKAGRSTGKTESGPATKTEKVETRRTEIQRIASDQKYKRKAGKL
jgi:hypothetical protein